MAPWACCSLEEEILAILETDSPATLRHVCAIIFPTVSWREAVPHAAGQIRRHCHFLAEQHLIIETEPDTFTALRPGMA